MSVDIVAALRAFLLDQSAVTDVSSGRIYGTELPKDDAAPMPRQALVLKPSGGPQPVRGYQELAGQRIDLRAYGATPFDAQEAERVTFEPLNQLVRVVYESVLIHSATPAGGFITGRDADTDWPLTVRSWQILFATYPAT